MEDRRIRRPKVIFEASELPVATENSKKKKRDVYKRLSTQINRDLEINWDANEARYNSLLIDEKISFAKNIDLMIRWTVRQLSCVLHR